MNNCLCCGKPLTSESETSSVHGGWHASCIKKFFGTERLPDVGLSQNDIESLADESAAAGITATGVQKKLSLHLYSDSKKNGSARLTLVGFPAGYILKPASSEYTCLPESEHLVMSMADAAGIETVPHALIHLADNSTAYITKRIDRTAKPSADETHRIAMEDFCQLSERLTEDKYKGSYEQCAKIIKKYSSQPGLDLSSFFYLIAFCFITGNSDMHLKNFSLIRFDTWKLSAAYDLLPVNIVNPSDTEETALAINGKKSNLSADDFFAFADTVGIPQRAAQKMTAALLSLQNTFIQMVDDSLIADEQKKQFAALINERSAILGGITKS